MHIYLSYFCVTKPLHVSGVLYQSSIPSPLTVFFSEALSFDFSRTACLLIFWQFLEFPRISLLSPRAFPSLSAPAGAQHSTPDPGSCSAPPGKLSTLRPRGKVQFAQDTRKSDNHKCQMEVESDRRRQRERESLAAGGDGTAARSAQTVASPEGECRRQPQPPLEPPSPRELERSPYMKTPSILLEF